MILPMLLEPLVDQDFRHSCRAGGVSGQSGRRVDAALFHSLRRTVIDGGVSRRRGDSGRIPS
ncbi:hypothetical protein ACLK1S_25455 [Escherichia coli]